MKKIRGGYYRGNNGWEAWRKDGLYGKPDGLRWTLCYQGVFVGRFATLRDCHRHIKDRSR